MKPVLKRSIIGVGALVVVAFVAFLYLIPPFFVAPPSTFIDPEKHAVANLDGIIDPAERAMAKRGQYLVHTIPCTGCHGTPTGTGPDLDTLVAGGMRMSGAHGTFVTRNLTPDKETGIGRRTDDEIKRVLRSGVFADGHFAPYTNMPWTSFSHLTEEDCHAIVVFLRHLKPVHHVTPEPSAPLPRAGETEVVWAGRDYGEKGK